VPIGRPIANARLYILDRQLQPVPSGVAGEIHIGGAGLARGYLNSPELTAEEFIPDLFSGEPGSRLYRTGDLGRYRSDGNIEFVGRIDHQVKLRGYRIELGEIETALGQHPSVRQCAAAVREEDAGDQRLVAYVASQPEIVFDAGELREWLKRRLPAYMIPWAWVRLDDLPLLPNGKIDRAVLPVPDQDRPELGNIYQAPRTPVEDTLAGIWAEVLKVDKIGIYDNFFDLGGHSLLATQIMSRIRSCFSIELPLRTLFESPTIEQMAAAIMEHQMKQSGQEEPERVLFELESPPDEKVHSLVAEEDRSTSAEERHE
jgi:acyl carrier protein